MITTDEQKRDTADDRLKAAAPGILAALKIIFDYASDETIHAVPKATVDADEASWADAYGDTEHARALDRLGADIEGTEEPSEA